MSIGDQFFAALISSLFDVLVAIALGALEAVVVPLLQAIPALLGLGG